MRRHEREGKGEKDQRSCRELDLAHAPAQIFYAKRRGARCPRARGELEMEADEEPGGKKPNPQASDKKNPEPLRERKGQAASSSSRRLASKKSLAARSFTCHSFLSAHMAWPVAHQVQPWLAGRRFWHWPRAETSARVLESTETAAALLVPATSEQAMRSVD
jgi:hypothetical protein